MDRRRLVALVLAGASFALAVAFGVLTFVCGGMEQGMSWDAATNQTTSYGPRCVSAFHPFTVVWAAFALTGFLVLWKGPAWVVVLLGGIGLGLGVLAGFSAGFYGIGCGALLLAAGLVGRAPQPEPVRSD